MLNRIIISPSPYRFAFLSTCLLATPVSSRSTTPILDPEFVTNFYYADQPNVIQFGDWVSLLTLCLAPLIAHVLAGVPRTVPLSIRRIRWHDWICIYNPTSILWRYLAIIDRRVRHKIWNPTDMASSNTYFWTEDGWDGSEETMARVRAYCTKAPEHHRTAIFSSETIKTLIIGAQGVQALDAMLGGLLAFYGIGNRDYGGLIALDSAFAPLAIFGLLRVFAAFYLTDDFAFGPVPDATEMPQLNSSGRTDRNNEISFLPERKEQSTFTMSTFGSSYTRIEEGFRPQSYWLAIVIRVLYLLPLCGLILMGVFEFFPAKEVKKSYFSPVSAVQLMLYGPFILVSTSLFVFYIALGKSTTTVIPCMNSILYKAYTCVLILAALALFISSIIYTRKSACGQYTTFPESYDQGICSGAPVYSDSQSSLFGMVAYIQNSTDSTNETREIAMVELDGWCSGVLGNFTVVDIIEP